MTDMDAVEEVKSRLSIEDVISEYVPLKRAGRNWKGLSPFSNERTPSFVVSPEKQIWHDFSSGKGGNVFSFVMEVEGLDFKAALELLARKAGIDIDQFRSRGRSGGPNKERLYEVLESTCRFYQVQFSKNKLALEYVINKRKFSKETALIWRLGYSPNNGSALVDYLKKQRFSDIEIKHSGLSTARYASLADMFRGRLMIPLQDAQGRVIGFTARLLADEPDSPKYINTPQTVLYDKSRHIYGLHLAKESIRKSQFVVITEGNLDVIASHQAGVRQVVATAGTALTEPNLKTLSRLTSDIRLGYDADSAGLNATERAIPIASRVKVSLSIISLPSGQDPDELIKQDPKLWQKIIQQQVYALDWLIERHQKLLDLNSAEGKRRFSDILLPVIRSLSDPVEQDHYLLSIAKLIGVRQEALTSKFKQFAAADQPTRQRQVKIVTQSLDRVAIDSAKTQDNLLSLTLIQPPLRGYLEPITSDMLQGSERQKLLLFLKLNPVSSRPQDLSEQSEQDYVKIVRLLYEELYQGLELTELHYEAARLQARLVEQFVKKQKQLMAHELESANDTVTQSLLERARQYDLLLKQVLGGRNSGQEANQDSR